jgi:enoyl-CoA hydratase
VNRVAVEVEEGVATITLDDPERRNAMSLAMVDGLEEAFDDLESNAEIGAVVITGTPPAFCSGADLAALAESSEETLLRLYDGFVRVGTSPLPTVAAVNGVAVGAGVNLALACDVRLAGASSRFETTFLQLALHPGGGHTWMVRHFAGVQTAAAMILFGEAVDGAGAERCGLAWRCVDDDDLLPEARLMARRVAEAPRQLARRMKETLVATGEIADHSEAVALELRPQLWSMDQPEFAERLRARLDRS